MNRKVFNRIVGGFSFLLMMYAVIIISFNYKYFIRWVYTQHLWVFVVCVPVVIFIRTIFKENLNFWETFQHEFTHLIFSVFSGNQINSFEVSRDAGGKFGYAGYSNWLITLSPYFFPLYSIQLVALVYIFQPGFSSITGYALFIIWLWFILQTISSFHKQQPDLNELPFLFSLAIILVGNFFFFFFIIHASTGRMHYFIDKLFQLGIAPWRWLF